MRGGEPLNIPPASRWESANAHVLHSIANQTRGWGQGIAGYGNSVKDAVGVGGPRVATAGNPLGIAGEGSSKGNTAKTSGRSAGKGSGANPLGLS